MDGWCSFYSELKTWQTGIAALFGLAGLAGAAFWNAQLNRQRDKAIRDPKRISATPQRPAGAHQRGAAPSPCRQHDERSVRHRGATAPVALSEICGSAGQKTSSR